MSQGPAAARGDDDAVRLDAVIFGGGAAGLWLLGELICRGGSAVLLESSALGDGQTVCAQGIIHGGLKYTLDGVLSGSAAAIREMPDLWRACLAGRRRPELTGTRVRATHCHLWRTATLRGRAAMIGARIGLRVAPQTVPPDERPPALAECPGTVARLDEPVIDPVGLIAELAERHRDAIFRIDAEAGLEFNLAGPGRVEAIDLKDHESGRTATLRPATVVFTAGAGNEALCRRAGVAELGQPQRRPLHMLMLRGPLPELNGHCVDGTVPRVTITADHDSAGRTVWQVGGQVAEDGVAMEREPFLRHAAAELRSCLPGVCFDGVQWSAYRVDRAEGAGSGGRPSDAVVAAAGNVVAAWPTKLALVPRLAERVADRVAVSGAPAAALLPDWPGPDVAPPPWERNQPWSAEL